MTYAVKLLPSATSPETLRNVYFKQVILIEQQLIRTAYMVMLCLWYERGWGEAGSWYVTLAGLELAASRLPPQKPG